MRKYLTAALLVLATPAAAADLDGPRDFYDGPPIGRWAGMYIGIHAGWAKADWDANVAHPCNCPTLGGQPTFTGSGDIGSDGFMGGFQVGWNAQKGNLVIGLEADVSGGLLEGGQTFRMDYDSDWKIESKINAFGTARLRVGTDMGGWMPYITGGLAWARTTTDMQTISITGPVVMSELQGKEWHIGWTVGAGSEWKIGRGVSFKVEYLYMDLGEANYDPSGTAYAGTPGAFAHSEKMDGDLTMHVVRAGLNYKF